MKKFLILFSITSLSPLLFLSANLIYPHMEISPIEMYGNSYKGLATKEMGASQFEVWRSSLGVGSKTPKHTHETEEVFIILRGHIRAFIGDEQIECIAPSTLICPAHIPHQLINVGDEPTDQILVLGIDSKIYDMDGKELHLPWRSQN